LHAHTSRPSSGVTRSIPACVEVACPLHSIASTPVNPPRTTNAPPPPLNSTTRIVRQPLTLLLLCAGRRAAVAIQLERSATDSPGARSARSAARFPPVWWHWWDVRAWAACLTRWAALTRPSCLNCVYLYTVHAVVFWGVLAAPVRIIYKTLR
jgi:hypothetical protein